MPITFVPAALGPIRVTRPSAGETTTSGSDGGTRFGSRKKNAIKSATTKRKPDTYQKPNAAAAMANSNGTRMYGTLSLTIRNASLSTNYPALPRSVLLTSKGTRNLNSTSPSISLNSEKLAGSFSDSSSDF